MRSTKKQSGYTVIEILAAIGLLGLGMYIVSSFLTLSGRELAQNQTALNFDLLAARINNMFKESNTCEQTSIVANRIQVLANGYTQRPLSIFDEFSVGSDRIADKKWDAEQQLKITAMELWQQTGELVPGSTPRRFLGRLHLRVKTNRDSSQEYVRDIPIVLQADAGNRIISCYSRFSTRIACEDLGWTYDPNKTPNCAAP